MAALETGAAVAALGIAATATTATREKRILFIVDPFTIGDAGGAAPACRITPKGAPGKWPRQMAGRPPAG
jgi:hypothetical protein